MNYNFKFKYYRRPFRLRFKTNYGIWTIREGILVRLEDREGNVGYGEIAPLHSFGSESMEKAYAYCNDLKGQFNDDLFTLMDVKHPACCFAFESACELLRNKCELQIEKNVQVAALLPPGRKALNILDCYSSQGFKTYKWKIGLDKIEIEQSVFKKLVRTSSEDVKFRLDANGSLSLQQAKDWLGFLENYNIEFLEQPLHPTATDDIFAIAEEYSTPIALDESVASIDSLKKTVKKGWSGFLIIKPSIMGSISKFRAWIKECNNALIFSSVFETAIGFQAGLQLAAEYGEPGYDAGYGVNSFFLNDGLSLHGDSPTLSLNRCSIKDFEEIWKHIGKN